MIDSSLPTHGFAIPPYKAQPSGGRNDWWYVENATGFNCLSSPKKPGAKFTSEAVAKAIAESWNRPPTG